MYKIIAIPALTDNYIWAIANANKQQVAVVDPGDAAPVIEFLTTQNMQLTAILLTHHHADHINGVPALLEFNSVPVYGPSSKYIKSVTVPLTDGDSINLSEQDIQLQIMEIPAHTLDHIAYFNAKVLFSGDTLFTGGCGRIFEGSAEQMLVALHKLSMLNKQTQVYCGHEYTENNLRFAALVEPNNLQISERLEKCITLRKQAKSTVPATIATELATNPFLRVRQPQILSAIEAHFKRKFINEIDAFAALRNWKNNF